MNFLRSYHVTWPVLIRLVKQKFRHMTRFPTLHICKDLGSCFIKFLGPRSRSQTANVSQFFKTTSVTRQNTMSSITKALPLHYISTYHAYRTVMFVIIWKINPRLTGVSDERHWPGGGRITPPPPQANSQTNDRRETGEAALERSRRDGSKALLNFS